MRPATPTRARSPTSSRSSAPCSSGCTGLRSSRPCRATARRRPPPCSTPSSPSSAPPSRRSGSPLGWRVSAATVCLGCVTLFPTLKVDRCCEQGPSARSVRDHSPLAQPQKLATSKALLVPLTLAQTFKTLRWLAVSRSALPPTSCSARPGLSESAALRVSSHRSVSSSFSQRWRRRACTTAAASTTSTACRPSSARSSPSSSC